MRFVASLQKNSYIHFSWRGAARIGGTLHNVFFKLRTNGQYVTDPLQADEVEELQTHPHVQIEMTADAPVLEARKKAAAPPPEPIALSLPEPEDVKEEETAPEPSEEKEVVIEDAAEPLPKKRGRPKKR